MAFESLQIHSTLNGASGLDGFREDLTASDAVVLSLTSSIGIASYRWELIGRPEGSAAGGAGPEPVLLGTAATASFSVDTDGAFHRDGSYVVRCTVNAGAPTETAIQTILARLSGLLTADGRPLRKPGAFESLDDTSATGSAPSWATQMNRWLDYVRTNSGGGGGSGGTSITMITGEEVDVATSASVVWQGNLDLSGLNFIRLLTTAKIATAGTGHIRIRVGGTVSNATDGTLVATVAPTATTFTAYDSGNQAITFSGVQLIKLVMDPAGITGTGVISAITANLRVE